MGNVLGKLGLLILLFTASTAYSDAPSSPKDSSTNDSKDAVEAMPQQPQPVRRTVTARVIHPNANVAGIRAQQEPGEFTIPEGQTATGFVYSFFDPKSGRTLDRITGSTIYSVTEKRYIREAEGNPQVILRRGKYKFVVGGSPGATGTLSYILAPGTPDDAPKTDIKDNVPGADIPRDWKLSVLLWVPDAPDYKFHWEFDIQRGVVAGRSTLPNTPSDHVQNYRAEYWFEGKVTGSRIAGEAMQKLSWESKPNEWGVMKHSYEGRGKTDLTLRSDHTVVGSEIHSGITNGEPSIQDRKIEWVGTWQVNPQPAAKP